MYLQDTEHSKEHDQMSFHTLSLSHSKASSLSIIIFDFKITQEPLVFMMRFEIFPCWLTPSKSLKG